MLTFPLLAQFLPDPCFYHFSRRKPFCLIRSLRCTEANHVHFILSESANYLNNPKQDEKEEVLSPSYILLYEDSEGDRMLVGDVPWEYVFGFFIFQCLFDIINYFQTIWDVLPLYENAYYKTFLMLRNCCRLFINSVKRLYITLDPRARKCGLWQSFYTAFFNKHS